MRLKRLELQGFKSFLDRTILTFEPGVTGVVGPNGCGKSNIVDAIQWVMGEQSAKHLRGEAMTDVIFNGSDSRPATSMAEVSLILEREGVSLAPQFSQFDKADEISVTRRVYRDGTGEYFINKTVCRLRDIHELFMDTGVGKRAYSIIEQGQIDRMINVKPEDRRLLFEEVAGITKYKAKRKEAEKKLEATSQNLTRLHDIIAELEKQIRSLKIQATRAKKYKEIKTELEVADLFVLGKKLFFIARKVEEITSEVQRLQDRKSELDALIAQVDADSTQFEVKRVDLEKTIQELSEKEKELALQLQRFEGELSLLAERKNHIGERIAGFQKEETSVKEKEADLRTKLDSEQAEKEALDSKRNSMEGEVEAAVSAVSVLQNEKSEKDRKREEVSRELQSCTSQIQLLSARCEHSRQREQDFSSQLEVVEGKLSDAKTQGQTLQDKLTTSDEQLRGMEVRFKEATEFAAEVDREVEAVSSDLSALEDGLFKMRENFHAKNSRVDSLKELQQNLEGFSPTVKEVLLNSSSAATSLAEVLKPTAEVEELIEILLDRDMNALIANSEEEAQALSLEIAEKGLERVRIIVRRDLEVTPDPEIFGCRRLLDSVRITPGFEGVVKARLCGCYLVDSSENLIQMRAQNPGRTFLATDRKIFSHYDTSLSSGVPPTKTGVFARKRELDELSAECQAIDAEIQKQNSQRENLLAHLESLEKRSEELKEKLSALHIENVELRKAREQICFEKERAQKDERLFESEKTQIAQQISQNRAEREGWEVEKGEIASKEELLKKSSEDLQLECQKVEELIREKTAALNQLRIESSLIEEQEKAQQYRIEKIEEELDECEHRLRELSAQGERDEKELVLIEQSKQNIETQRGESEQKRAEVQQLFARAKEDFAEVCTHVQDLREKRTSSEKERGEVSEKMQELELSKAQTESDLSHQKGLCLERYEKEPSPLDESVQLDLTTVPLFNEGLSVEWAALGEDEKLGLLDEHLKTLKEKVARYGEVNLTAIQEFDEIQKRYDFLIQQRTDLESAIELLKNAIEKIDETTKTRFQETFTAVNEKFREIFPILFNGGKAELTLTTNETTQEMGVDVLVHPPGKRPASITLLSGGEKALTAVSLILAIFARKPSPFCLLDEVDAPLDDANVSRFNTVIRKMAEKTQFIVITHNKKTMEVAEALYGVTMERSGISKMTSVRLN